MDQILIKDLLCRGVIGISDAERANKQNILVNLVLLTNTMDAGQSDSIDDCVNYSTVAKQVMALTETAARFTVEALVADIARLCLSFDRVDACRVRVEKPGAVRFAGSVGVEIERDKRFISAGS